MPAQAGILTTKWRPELWAFSLDPGLRRGDGPWRTDFEV